MCEAYLLTPEKEDQKLSALMQAANIALDMPCNGNQRCGRCKVKVSGALSPVSPTERALLGREAFEAGYRLACFAKVKGEVKLEVGQTPAAAEAAEPVVQAQAEMREMENLNIVPAFDEDWLLHHFHCEKDDFFFETAVELWEEVKGSFHPGYVVREFAIDEQKENVIVVQGRAFISKVLPKKLKDVKTVFVYIASCGDSSVTALIDSYKDDAISQYVVDALAYMVYNQAMNEMTLALEEKFGIKRYMRLIPGSVMDWRVSEVRKIFSLMDGVYQKLGVYVKESGLIDPLKSTSGFFYETTDDFESCAICPRVNCPDRRLPYDAELHEKMVGNL